MDDQPYVSHEHQPAHEPVSPRRSAAERAERREAARRTMLVLAAKIRNRATRQRIQAALCVGLIAILLLGGGVFFYYAQTIALK